MAKKTRRQRRAQKLKDDRIIKRTLKTLSPLTPQEKAKLLKTFADRLLREMMAGTLGEKVEDPEVLQVWARNVMRTVLGKEE